MLARWAFWSRRRPKAHGANAHVHQQKKPPAHGWGGKPFLLSHIKAPLREEKRGDSKLSDVEFSNVAGV